MLARKGKWVFASVSRPTHHLHRNDGTEMPAWRQRKAKRKHLEQTAAIGASAIGPEAHPSQEPPSLRRLGADLGSGRSGPARTTAPVWAKIRVRHARAVPATGAWERRVEAAEKGSGWTGSGEADVAERRGALLTLDVDALDGTCAEELSLVTATCPPNGLAVVWPPGAAKRRAGEQVGVAVAILCGALACPCEGRLAAAMRAVEEVVRGTNWVEVMSSWGRGVHGVGHQGSKDRRRGHFRFGGGWTEMIDCHGTEPLEAGGQTYPRRAVGHRHSAAYFRLTLPVISALFRCADATPYLAPHARRMREHVDMLRFPWRPQLSWEAGRPVLQSSDEAAQYACAHMHPYSSLCTMGANVVATVAAAAPDLMAEEWAEYANPSGGKTVLHSDQRDGGAGGVLLRGAQAERAGHTVVLSPDGGPMLQPVFVISMGLGAHDALCVVGLTEESYSYTVQMPALQHGVSVSPCMPLRTSPPLRTRPPRARLAGGVAYHNGLGGVLRGLARQPNA